MTLDATNTTEKRPTFLTVLCILTFIGSGLGLLGGLLGLVGVGFLSKMLPGAAGGMTIAAIIGLLASAGKLFGAMQMWKLKLQGLWIYIACEVVGLIGVIVNAMNTKNVVSSAMDTAEKLAASDSTLMTNPQMNDVAKQGMDAMATGVSTMSIVSAVFFSLLFIALYFMNKKHLK